MLDKRRQDNRGVVKINRVNNFVREKTRKFFFNNKDVWVVNSEIKELGGLNREFAEIKKGGFKDRRLLLGEKSENELAFVRELFI